MEIKELTIQAFTEFTKNSPLKNFMQTEEYARVMGEEKYNYDYIGLVDDSGLIRAASLILWRRIGFNTRYGYAPKGFLINYYDEALIRIFVEKLKSYYHKKNFIFIKIDPEIVVSEIDPNTYENYNNPNMRLKQDLRRYGFLKLKDNIYFESLNPRFNAYVDLKNTDIVNYAKAHRNKVRNAKRKGLYIEKGDQKDIEAFYRMLNTKENISHYKNMYNYFGDKLDFILVKVSYEEFIKNSQSLYEIEQDRNNLYNVILRRSNKESDLHRKMDSDTKLGILKDEIRDATAGLQTNDNCIVAGAFIVKYENRVHVVESGFDKDFKNLNANYFLYDAIINNYKDEYEFLDLGGIAGSFKKDDAYRGLNRFKLGFNTSIFEYIGEFDLIFSQIGYDSLLASGKLASEFNKN